VIFIGGRLKIEFMDELPLNAVGKVLKREFREMMKTWAGCWMLDAQFWILDARYWIVGTEYRAPSIQ